MTRISGSEHSFADFLLAHGSTEWVQDGLTHGRCELRPDMYVPGTDHLRLGHLLTLADLVGGRTPQGALIPTVDIRVRLLGRAPAGGAIDLVARPLKQGTRMYHGEVWISADGAIEPFAHSIVTFLNNTVADAPGPGPVEPPPPYPMGFDEILRVRYPDARTVEIDPAPAIANGPGRTVLGAAQGCVAELAVEHALSERGRFGVVDMDVRFLNRVEVGPLVATADTFWSTGDEASAHVTLVDRGNDERRIAFASAVARRI